jgi:uncharacterized protein YxeA
MSLVVVIALVLIIGSIFFIRKKVNERDDALIRNQYENDMNEWTRHHLVQLEMKFPEYSIDDLQGLNHFELKLLEGIMNENTEEKI